MKKIISMLLVIALTLSVLMPAAFAGNAVSDEMEKVLISVKSRIDIPSELGEFESNVTKYSEKTCYNFDWHDKNHEKSIAVTADKSGRITSYYNYFYSVSGKKLSAVSKKEIIAFADSFIKKALPEMHSDSSDVLVFDADSYNTGGSLRYNFTYNRHKNSLPVKDNYVNVTVCISENDEPYIRNMSANINYDASFTEKKSEIADFAEKYKKTFPLELVYQNEYNHDWKAVGMPRTTTALIYRIKDNNAGFISAETGEIVQEDKMDNQIFREEATADTAMGGMNKNNLLTEKELAEITAVEGLLEIKEIETKIKSLPYIKFPDGIKLENSSLSKNDSGEYVYNLHYTNKTDEAYRYLHLSAYAQNGKLISFYQNSDKTANKDIELSLQQKRTAEKKITQFLTAAAEEFKETKLEKSEDKNGFINSYYYREVNSIKHINNGISITFDTQNAVVTSFSLDFTEGEFQDPLKAIGEEEAYNKLTEYSPIVKMYVKAGGSYIECVTLEKKGVILDGVTGMVKNAYNDGNTSFSYSDIKGHWAENAASKLAEIQVGFSGDKLNPGSKVTQEELLRLLASGIYGKYYHTYSQDDLYNSLIREKIITEEEKNPESEVKREDAFVYIIRMAGLERVARLEGIYKIDYADGGLLSKGIGYTAILSGLGVICGNGGYLRPLDTLTRAEAIVMLYRYLLTLE